ncbi:MAG: ABC transporter substrate-binding protein [Erysipelotrichaceae bacterium]|nr:ABC transporter substrate-binding protein [Erysipelotrichaceae bacterium]
MNHKIDNQKKKRKGRSLLAVLLLCLCLGGCSSSGSQEEAEQAENSEIAEDIGNDKEVEAGLVRIALSSPISTIDVHKNTEDYMLPLNVYERLFDIRVSENGTTSLAKGLAEDWSVSDDGLVYHFTLRDDAFFSDGTKVKASDVAFTFTRMLALPDSQQTDFADMILGAKEVMAGETETLKGIRILDDRNLEITLSEPFAGYLYQLATPSCSILSEKSVREAGDGYGLSVEHTMGSGPYRLSEYTDSRITVERNPYYHCHDGEELTIQQAEFLILPPALIDRMFREGQLDLLDVNRINPEVVKTIYNTEEWKDSLIDYSRVEVQYLMLNMEMPPLNDVRIRKAVQMAIDRQKILDELYNGNGNLLDGIYPKGLIGYSEENQGWLKYDPKEAAKLIDEVPGAKEVRLELAANSQSEIRTLRMLEMIRQDLNAVGLNVATVSYDEDSRFYLRKEGLLMAYTGEWSADFNDPDNFIYTFFGSRAKSLYRSSNFADETLIRRIGKARALQDEEERLQEYAELEKILIRDEAVWVPLFSTSHQFILGERLESFTPFWAGWGSLYLKDIVLKPEAR